MLNAKNPLQETAQSEEHERHFIKYLHPIIECPEDKEQSARLGDVE